MFGLQEAQGRGELLHMALRHESSFGIEEDFRFRHKRFTVTGERRRYQRHLGNLQWLSGCIIQWSPFCSLTLLLSSEMTSKLANKSQVFQMRYDILYICIKKMIFCSLRVSGYFQKLKTIWGQLSTCMEKIVCNCSVGVCEINKKFLW